jgi:hypothetical protein
MQRLIITAALAFGLVRVAVLPLAAQQVSSTLDPAMSRALFLCRTQQGIDQKCAAGLAKALLIEQPKRDATAIADRNCHLDPRAFSEKPGSVHE